MNPVAAAGERVRSDDIEPWPAPLLLSSCAAGGAAGLAAGICMGLVDGLVAVRAGGALVLLLAVCLHALPGLFLGVLVGLVAGGVREVLPRRSASLWRILSEEPERDRLAAAAALALAFCVLSETALVFAFARGPAASMANPRLAALSTALVSGGGVVLGGLLFFPAWRALARLGWLLPRGRSVPATVIVLGVMLLALLGAGIWVLSGLDWRTLRAGPWLVLLAMSVLTVLGTWAFIRRSGAFIRRPLTALALCIGVAVGLSLVAPAAGTAEAVAGGQRDGALLPWLISIGRALCDGDGDGFSARFAGGDCDDGDARVNPAARDIPGNGIDENCAGGDALPPKRAHRREPRRARRAAAFTGNVLLLCIDTLRADMLGRPDRLTANIDRLAARGVVFAETYAQAANTPQSFPSIFTSLYPSRVPYRKAFAGYPVVRPEAQTVFELLSARGIVTAAVTSHFYFKPKQGITQGIDDWDNRDATNLKDSNKDVASPRIVPRALAKLKQLAARGKRFALFVHLFEPHSTYVKHAQFPITKRGVKGLRQKYDYEVKFVDDWVGKLLAGLDQSGLRERTAVLLFSDHAEAFGEHRFYFHGQALYNEVLRVPLILALPGVKPRVVRERAALLDLAPTMLELFGLPIPERFAGLSLLGAAQGSERLPERRIGAVLMPYPAWPKGQEAMLSARYKAISRTTENRFEVYDLRSDPGERSDLAGRQPQLAARLRAELARFSEQQLR